MKDIVFVTGNQNKLKEVQAILSYSLKCHALDLEEIQGTPMEVSSAKCRRAAEILCKPVITEDTSLCFNALNGLPGVYIKWFLDSIGHQGLNNLLEAYPDKSAYAQCIFAYGEPNKDPILFIGQTHGKIVPARGPTNFGWDPVFQPDGFNETYAEMDKTIKNGISHRYKALMKLKDFLQSPSP
jgi:inosine triphosphate pyrophosphatase